MDDKSKKILWFAGAVGFLVLAAAGWRYVDAYSRSIVSTSRSFSVQGKGKIVAVPDIATFTFSVVTQGGTDLVKLQTENTGKVNKAVAFVKSKMVESKDIQTSGYSLEPRYEYFSCEPSIGEATPCPPPRIVGYTITQTVSVKIRDFNNAGDIVSGVVSEGANRVSELTFAVDDPLALQNQARAKAIENAKEKALFLSNAGKFRIGRLLGIDENGDVPIYYGRTTLGIGIDSAEKTTTPAPVIEPGSQDITVNITLRYEIR